MLTAARIMFVLTTLLFPSAVACFIWLAWKQHCWIRHGARRPDIHSYLFSFLALILCTIVSGVLGGRFAKNYVQSWADTTLQQHSVVSVNGRAGDYQAFLTELSKLQPDPPNHSTNTGSKSSYRIESAGRELDLVLWQKTPQSEWYSVKVRIWGTSNLRYVEIGKVHLNGGTL